MNVTTPVAIDNKKWRSLESLAPLLLILAVGLAYANAQSGVFLFDDYKEIVRQPQVMSLATALTGTSRPILYFSFWLNYAVEGFRVEGFHLLNLLIHISSVLLLYGIVRRTLEAGKAGDSLRSSGKGLALACALLWGVHPLMTGSVTYICQRGESLMGFFYLLTLYSAVRGLVEKKKGWLAVGLAACWLGAGTKEVMITAPLLVLLYDRTFVSGSFRQAIRRHFLFYAGLASSWAMVWLLTRMALRIQPEASYVWEGISPLSYLVTQAAVIAHYLKLLVWPSGLCLDYRWPVERLGDVLGQFLLISALGGATLYGLWRRPSVAFLSACFFLMLAPTSSLFPRPDAAFEHRMYLPAACLIVFAVILVYRFLASRVRPEVVRIVAAALVVTLLMLTRERNAVYGSEVGMWRDVVAQRPDNLRAANDYAVALSSAGWTEEAVAAYQMVLDRIPSAERERLDTGGIPPSARVLTDSPAYHYFRAHANLGLLLHKELGRIDEAIRHYVLASHAGVMPEWLVVRLKEALRARGVPEALLDQEVANVLSR